MRVGTKGFELAGFELAGFELADSVRADRRVTRLKRDAGNRDRT